jgi:hypothetical protein
MVYCLADGLSNSLSNKYDMLSLWVHRFQLSAGVKIHKIIVTDCQGMISLRTEYSPKDVIKGITVAMIRYWWGYDDE